MLRRYVLIAALCLLSACSTMKANHNENGEDEHARKIKTAKINAQLGIAYLERNNMQRSKQKLLLALNQAPDIPEPWYSMGYFFEATGNIKLAKHYYLKAVEIAPNRGDTHNNYGTFLCRLGEYRAAIHQFLLAVQDVNYLDSAAAYENAGICAKKMPHYEQAIHYFDLALMHDVSRPISLINLAELHYKLGHYQLAQIKLDQYLIVGQPNAIAKRLQAKIDRQLLNQKKPVSYVKVFTAQLDDAHHYHFIPAPAHKSGQAVHKPPIKHALASKSPSPNRMIPAKSNQPHALLAHTKLPRNLNKKMAFKKPSPKKPIKTISHPKKITALASSWNINRVKNEPKPLTNRQDLPPPKQKLYPPLQTHGKPKTT